MRFKTSITSGANLRNGSFRCSFLALHLVCGNMLQWLAAGSLHRAFQLLRVLLDEQRAECCHTEIDFDVALFQFVFRPSHFGTAANTTTTVLSTS